MKQVEANRDWLVRRAIQGAPQELCGFIMRDGSVVEIPNSATEPTRTFAMSRLHLVERVPRPKNIVALWHSHPNGNPEPSWTDTECMKQFPDWLHVIVTPNGIHYDST